jgi:hypothetical protein
VWWGSAQGCGLCAGTAASLGPKGCLATCFVQCAWRGSYGCHAGASAHGLLTRLCAAHHGSTAVQPLGHKQLHAARPAVHVRRGACSLCRSDWVTSDDVWVGGRWRSQACAQVLALLCRPRGRTVACAPSLTPAALLLVCCPCSCWNHPCLRCCAPLMGVPSEGIAGRAVRILGGSTHAAWHWLVGAVRCVGAVGACAVSCCLLR